MPILNSLIYLLLLGAGLFLPGWLLSRLLGTRGERSTAFLGSAALLLNLLLLLDGLNISLTAGHVALGLGTTCLILIGGIKFRNQTSQAAVNADNFSGQRQYWWLVPAAIGFIAIAIKATLDPLSGLDTFFRWDFLARQMFSQANLHFYPPFTSGDFLHYGWCDGIAPLVSSLYFWAYLSAGETAKWATTLIVIGQALLLFGAVHRLATTRNGPAAGDRAIALLAINPVLLWGVAMGQETGLTALSLVAMFLFIERHRAAPAAHWLVWAGLAAGIGALAREYGLAFVGLGAVALIWYRVSKRGRWEFVISAALVAFPWYLRNWLRTGNPLYSQNLAGLFPVNPINAEYLRLAHEATQLATPGATAIALVLLLVGWVGVTLFVGIAGMVKFRREQIPWLIALTGITVFWFWSSVRTSGGLVYSLRVMTPAIALAAAAGGCLLVQWKSPRWGWLVVVLVTFLSIDASERSRFMPFPSQVVWWKKSPSSWLQFSWPREPWANDTRWSAIASAAKGRQILVSDPYSFTIFTELGAHPIPIFSPAVRFLFEPDAQLAPNRARLREEGVRFVLITKDQVQLPLHLFFKSLTSTRPIMETENFSLYDLDPAP